MLVFDPVEPTNVLAAASVANVCVLANTIVFVLWAAEAPAMSILAYTVAKNDSLVLPVYKVACSGIPAVIEVVILICSPFALLAVP